MIITSLFIFICCDEKQVIEEKEFSMYDIDGAWYNESINEELSFANGIFNSTTVNYYLYEHINGTYSVESSILSESFDRNGHEESRVWKINKSNPSLELISSTEKAVYNRIVKTLTLSTFDTISCSGLFEEESCKILDDRLLKIEDGLLLSCAIKGATYLEISKDGEKQFIKVYVGVDDGFHDYWYDYSKIIDSSHDSVKQEFGSPMIVDIYDDSYYWRPDSLSNGGVSELLVYFDDEKVCQVLIKFTSDSNDSIIVDYLQNRFYEGLKASYGCYYYNYPNIDYLDTHQDNFMLLLYEPDKKRLYYERYW